MTEEEKSRIPFPSAKKKAFYEKYNHLTDSEVQKELLYYNQLKINKLERIRSNTSTLVWCLIVLPIILGFLLFVTGAMAL